jgi:hypothetical protein
MNIAELLKNEYVRGVLVLLVGITIGALFYPTKKVEEKTSQKYEQEIKSLKEQHSQEISKVTEQRDALVQSAKEFHLESDRKITTLASQVSQLKSKQKISTYKLVKPDGTIEERSFTENDIDQSSKAVTSIQDEFKQKIDAIETKWSQIHATRVAELQKQFDSKEQAYQNTIASLEKTKTTTVNAKQFGIEAGIMSDKDYYAHANADLWGPIFVGLQVEIKPPSADEHADNRVGAGIGMRF